MEESREIASLMEEELKVEVNEMLHSKLLKTDCCSKRKTSRHRVKSDSSLYQTQEVEELVKMLRQTVDMEEQGDILQYMVGTYGMDFTTESGSVHELVMELYYKACQAKNWSIV